MIAFIHTLGHFQRLMLSAPAEAKVYSLEIEDKPGNFHT